MLMPPIVSGAVPLTVTVTVCGPPVVATRCAPNDRLAGLSDTTGAGAAPVPVSVTVCGLSAASSTTVTVALRDPPSLGVKVTEIAQEDAGGSAAGATGQSFVCAKSAAFVPSTVIREIVSAPPPAFESVETSALP